MDSFVLAETFKYLYLMFAEPSDLIIDLDDFLFTTEAHLLPLSLSRIITNHTIGAYSVSRIFNVHCSYLLINGQFNISLPLVKYF